MRTLDAHPQSTYTSAVYHPEGSMSRRSAEAATKQATNVSIRRDLVAAAREAGINLSETLERALVAELNAKRKERWLEENREAIATYNSYVEERGVFSDGLRSF
jgi:antitoxin CcdA